MNALRAILILSFVVWMSTVTSAQSLTFNYQGHLTSGGLPANGNYDFEFALFSALSGGSQTAGSPLIINGVTVTNGLFTVALNFGNQFPGANRYLEVRVRLNGSLPEFTTLSPRQQINSSPYAITAANAANAVQLGGVAANQYVITTDPRMTDARQPVAGNSNYVQNRTTVQTGTNFNISGVGNASVFNAATQFNLNATRILGVGSGTSNTFGGLDAGASASNLSDNNTFFGNSAGQSMVTAGGNSFFGSQAGQSTTAGTNTFIGSSSGRANTSGTSNSFLGYGSGDSNTTGDNNSFFGRSAGSGNTDGASNSFFGVRSGLSNISSGNNSYFGFEAGRASTAAGNSFFGYQAGRFATTGTNNTFIGLSSGVANTTGDNNTLLGANTNLGSADLNFATAIGAGVTVSSGNNVVIGRSIDKVSIPGRLEIAGAIEAPGSDTIGFANRVNFDQEVEFQQEVLFNSNMGSIFPSGGITPICSILVGPNDAYRMPSKCSSSRRFKTSIMPFAAGLSLLNRLRPVMFNWKSDLSADIGFIAEEVAEVEPLLATTDQGKIEGVKYDRISVVLVNAVKEQQAQIEKLQKQVEALIAANRSFKSQINSLRAKSIKKK